MKLEHRIEAYLNGPRYTLWTFIKKFERSKDPAHARRMKRAMFAALEQLRAAGEVHRTRSLKGGRSWRRYTDAPPF